MWVAQYRQYPYPAGVTMISRDKYYRSKYDRVPAPPPNHVPGADVISVHEDRDGDGRYEIHSVANGLTWGPDGWFYGAQGSTTTSRVTRPGVDAIHAPGVYAEGCMSWRYHPERKLYEICTDGSGNTFGLSFDAEGRLFTEHNGGVTRGWHHIQEGLFLKQGKDPGKFGPSQNPFAFGELPMMHSTHPVPRFSHMTILGEGTALPDRLRGKDLPLERGVDLAKKSTPELIQLLAHANPWHRQTAVRLLSERHDALALPRLLDELDKSGTHPALEALWALHQMGWLDDARAAKTLTHPAVMVRAWTIRLRGDERKLSASLAALVTARAAVEPDAEVRCQILSTARRLPAAQALPLVRAIALRTNDIADAFIPLMAWFVIESQCASQREAVMALFDDAQFWRAPFVRQHLESRLMRRLAASGTRQELMACALLLAKAPTDEDRQVLMLGFEEAFPRRPTHGPCERASAN